MLESLNDALSNDSMLEKLDKPVARPLLKDGENRHVAVLFADVRGFTAMSERLHHEVVQDLMDKILYHFSLRVQKYGGYVDKYEGDKIMAHFGSKKFLEQTSRRAIYAGLELIDVIERFNDIRSTIPELSEMQNDLAIRVGINSGIVTTGKMGLKREGDFTTMGDVVNVGARMEENGDLNRVMVPQTVRDEVKDYFLFQFKGDVHAKGKSLPIPCWLVQRIRHRQVGRVVSDNIFVGRFEQLAKLNDIYREHCEKLQTEGYDQKVSVIGVKGNAGIGKTRLIEEFLGRLDRDSVVRSQMSPLVQPPFAAIASLLRSLFHIHPDSSREFATKRISFRLREFMECLPGIFQDTCQSIEAAILFILGFQVDEDYRNMDREEFIAQINYATLILVQAVIKRSNRLGLPLIIYFDDIHWIDEASLNTVNYLIKNINRMSDAESPKHTVIMMLAYREGFIPTSVMFHQAHFTEIHLKELESFHIHHLINELLAGVQIPYELKQQLVRSSAGNPFYLEQWIRQVRERVRLNPGYPFKSEEIPNDINSLILSLINDFSKDAVKLLQKASAIGNSFYRNVLDKLGKLLEDDTDIDREFKTFIEADLLMKQQSEHDEHYIFQHQLVRDAVYSTILDNNKKILSKLIAQIIEQEFAGELHQYTFQLADHFHTADMKEKCREYAEKAQNLALSLSMNLKALSYNTQLLIICQESITPNFYLQRAQLLMDMGKYSEAMEILRNIQKAASNHSGIRSRYFLTVTRLYLASGERIKARKFLTSHLDKISEESNRLDAEIMLMDIRRNEVSDDSFMADSNALLMRLDHFPNLKAKLLNIMGLYQSRHGEYRKALENYQLALRQSISHKSLLRFIFHNIGNTYAKLGDKDKAIEYLHKTLTLARLIDDVGGCGKVLSDLATVYMTMNKTTKALSMLEESLDVARVTGNLKHQGVASYNIAVNYFHLGEFAKAREYLRQSVDICRELSDDAGLCHANDLLGDILYEEGMFAQARKTYLSNLECQMKLQDQEGIAHTYGNLGNIAAEENDLDTAEDFYRKQQEILHRIGDIEGEAKAWFNWGALDGDRERYPEAKEKITHARNLFTQIQAHIYLDQVNEYLTELEKLL